jgi:acetyl esterase/lipase
MHPQRQGRRRSCIRAAAPILRRIACVSHAAPSPRLDIKLKAYTGSRTNLLGKNPDEELVQSLSNEEQVTRETPPTFLVHANDDKGVPPENTIYFYLALRKAGVPAEMHIYENGGHGFGLGKKDSPAASWPLRCADWMRGQDLLAKVSEQR